MGTNTAHDWSSDQESRALKTADKESAAALYESHAPIVYGLLLRMVTDPSVAGELLKATFVSIVQDLGAIAPSPAAILSKAHRLAREWQMNHPRRSNIVESRTGIDARTRPEAAALEMAYFDGMTIEEIAQRESVQPAQVRRWLISGVRRLRNVTSPRPALQGVPGKGLEPDRLTR